MPPDPKLSSTIAPRPYLREEVYNVLRKHVTELATSSSTMVSLREIDLARTFGVSRTPVREALNRLSQEGLVEMVPRRGAYVLPASLDEYLCWLEIREVIEGLSARRAASLLTPEGIAKLRAIFDGRSADDFSSTGFAEANVTFHAMLIEAGGSPLLIRLSRTYNHFAGARLRITSRLGRIEQSIQEHKEIVDALEQRDGAKAEELARRHVRMIREAAARTLTNLEP